MPTPVYARRIALALLIPSIVGAQAGAAGATAPAPAQTTIAAKTAGFERRDGFVPLYLDSKQGRLYAELPRETNRALFWVSLATATRSTPAAGCAICRKRTQLSAAAAGAL